MSVVNFHMAVGSASEGLDNGMIPHGACPQSERALQNLPRKRRDISSSRALALNDYCLRPVQETAGAGGLRDQSTDEA